jgi:hypothetical protein
MVVVYLTIKALGPIKFFFILINYPFVFDIKLENSEVS